jgi:hypothetical protein
MTQHQFIVELLAELSYRSDEGYPILSKVSHQQILEDILEEWGFSELKGELIQNLMEASEDRPFKNPDLNKEIEYTNASGDRAKGKVGNLIRRPKEEDAYKQAMRALGGEDSDRYKKAMTDLGGENQPGRDIEKEREAGDSQPAGQETQPERGTAVSPDTPQGREYRKGLSKKDPAKARNFSKENGKVVADFTTRAKTNREFLSGEQQAILDDAMDLVEDLYDDNLNDDEKRESANKLAELVKFTTNSTGEKAYFNVFGGNRKIISGKAGTKKAADLVNKMKQYAEVKQTNFSAIKNNFSAAAKPDLGKDSEVLPKNNELVKNLFEGNEILQRINPSLHGIFAVKDENGNPKIPSNQHSKEYLEQSIKNPALDRTIELAEKLAKDGTVDPKVATSLKEHKDRLEKVLKDITVPSEDAAKAIGDSYNTLMVDLHNADEDVAGAIMKQLAENRLYEESLAKGDEVYLPSRGNFPAGDMIKVVRDEEGNSDLVGVSLVSCKFGKQQRTYGCPANAKAIQSVHPNPEKRNNVGQYIGESGNTLVLKDELWRGDTDDETKEKTKSFVKTYLDEIELGDLFNDGELDEYATILTEYANEIDNIKSELRKNPTLMQRGNADKYWGEFSARLSKVEKVYSQRMGSIMTPDKIEKLIGKNNVGNARNTRGEVSPAVALCMINDANNIRTSDGYGLSHNKQYYDDNGNPTAKTDDGTANPNDYSITYRMSRTAGRAGGGPQYSFSGDGEEVDVVATKSGETYDRKTGEDIG